MTEVAYITDFNLERYNQKKAPKNQLGHWGRCYYIAKSLEAQSLDLNYQWVDLKKDGGLTKLRQKLYHGKEWAYQHLFNQTYHDWAELYWSREYARKIQSKLLGSDIAIAPDINLLSYLECDRPPVLWVDTLYAGLIDFYPDYTNLCPETRQNLTTLDRLALTNCQLAIFSSDWAAKPALETYKIDPAKVKVIPSGANIQCNRTVGDIEAIVARKPSNKCKLLFLGVDWYRKGGDTILAIAKELNKAGLPVELTVVGCHPIVGEPLPDFVVTPGFISKSTPAGVEKINQLIKESHFLIMLSKAETYGNVFCEANSFGVPCIGSSVGGIPTIIKDGLNGKVFPLDAEIGQYCKYIADSFSNYSDYHQLALSSFNQYQTRLNWSVAGKTAKSLLMKLI